MDPLAVIDETNHILVVWKDAGVLSQADGSALLDVQSLAKDYLKTTHQKKGEAYCALVQRLDCPVSGLMVLAKSSKGASRLSASLRAGLFTKEYLAFVTGTMLGDEGSLTDRLEKVDMKALPSTSGKVARLSWRALGQLTENGISGTLVRVTLLTGRYQQIRAQFALAGHPLYGDRKYGYVGPAADIALSCVHLAFPDPVSGETRTYDRLPTNGNWPEIIKGGMKE